MYQVISFLLVLFLVTVRVTKNKIFFLGFGSTIPIPTGEVQCWSPKWASK